MAARDLTHDDIVSMLEERRNLFGPLHAQMQIDEDFDTWSSEFASGKVMPYLTHLPKDYKPKAPPIAQMGVDIGLNNIMVGDRASVKVTLPANLHNNAKRAQEHAEYLEDCLSGILKAIDLYSTESPFRDFCRQTLAQGVGVLSYSIDWDRWDDPPFGTYKSGPRAGKPREGNTPKERAEYRRWRYRRDRTVPFNVRSTAPKTVFWDPHHDPPQNFIIEEEVGTSEIQRAYPDLDLHVIAQRAPAEKGGQPTVTRVTYQDQDVYGIWIGGKAVLNTRAAPEGDGANEEGIAPNRSGVLGHRMALGGFGVRDSENRLVNRVQGLIRRARDVIVMKVVLLNAKESLRQNTAHPTLMVSGEDLDEARDAANDLEIGTAALNAKLDRIKVEYLQAPAIPDVLFKLGDEVDQLLEILLGPEILRGIFRDDTATGQATRMSVAQAPYRPAKYACQQAVAAFLSDVCYYLKHELEEPIWVPGTSGPKLFDPKEIPDAQFLIEVDFSPPTEEERAFKRANAEKDLAAGAMTRAEYIKEVRNVQDSRKKMIEIDAEKMYEGIIGSESMQLYVQQKFMAERGLLPPAPPATPEGGGGPPAMPPGPGAPPMQPPQQPMMEEEMPPTLGSAGYAQDQAEELLGAPMVPQFMGAGR